jgi:hypothetical protein
MPTAVSRGRAKCFGYRMAEEDRGAGENEQRQRVTRSPGQPVFDDIPDVGSAGGNARHRRNMIGFERVLHSE